MNTADKGAWLAPPSVVHLEDGEVHVWRVDLLQTNDTLRACHETLAPDERERAGRFHFQKDRDRFVLAHGAIRSILSRYVQVTPASLRFSHNQYGKPALANHPGSGPLHFNVSHSEDIALCAVARGRELGVDVEFIRADFAGMEVAERFFSEKEVEMLRLVPAELRTVAFFNCWTRKEAYIKARGEGLSYPLGQFTVSLHPGAPAEVIEEDKTLRGGAMWTLIELKPRDGYASALAVEPPVHSLHRWLWSPP